MARSVALHSSMNSVRVEYFGIRQRAGDFFADDFIVGANPDFLQANDIVGRVGEFVCYGSKAL